MDNGHCDQDRTHLANATLATRRRSSATRCACSPRTGGCPASSTSRSGQWLNITTGVDNALNGQLRPAPEQGVGRRLRCEDADQLPEPARRSRTGAGTFGDLRVSRRRRAGLLGDRHGAVAADQSRRDAERGAPDRGLQPAEHFNWGVPGTNFTNLNAQFGRIKTHGGTPRIMQFGIKYGFYSGGPLTHDGHDGHERAL